MERIHRKIQQQISWEEARFNRFKEGIYTVDDIEIRDGRLYWRGLEISRFFPIYELEKDVIGQGRSEGRDEPVYFYLGRDAAEAVFKGEPVKYEGSRYSLISELIDVIEEFPTDCDKSQQYFKGWLESEVERAAESLREDAQTEFEEYGRNFDYETLV